MSRVPDYWIKAVLKETLQAVHVGELIDSEPDLRYHAAVKLFDLYDLDDLVKMEDVGDVLYDICEDRARAWWQEDERQRRLAAKEDAEKI